ncbi:MAG TPA: gamma-glutamyltransferase [Gemmatimonadaceae bacterium]|uniref:Glutathione hydrolase proenzyme n=1 Tax=uncultured Gemmatimonadetes bacterium Rifle_16ft_4_minimus_37772 TaxID=1665097 RepID=A0A0H4T509_9BACT|nr:ggt, gamma-glutamyltranspeptidase precursor, gamma-glutamyltranspeptidase [uncultured Gemmatimonadetes bacterium Rifle_16ft_4_minimus_37772]HLA90085.1 gamma-glutamyltransferase [Gemmatimonadaceae bacterium]
MRSRIRSTALSRAAMVVALLAACRQQPTPGPIPAPGGGVPGPVPPVALIELRDPAAVAEAAARAAFPGGWRFPVGTPATFAEHAMVVSNSKLASEAGVEILKAGGNAVDAAVATGFALAVTYPSAGNIGGGGFMNIRMADGRIAVIDYREVAPLAATRDMYLGPDGKLTNKSTLGYLASGVPGSVAGLAEALKKYGSLPLAKVMAPAIRLAEEGFVVDSAFSRGGACSRQIAQFEGRAVFCPGGSALKPGARLVQADLARTLKQIAADGPKAFYEGAIADSLVAEEVRGGGIITKEDLRRYKPVWRTPIRSTYRGYTLFTMPPASSGGITMTETLNILEHFAPLPPAGSVQYAHLLAESYRRSFMDRNSKLGDPAFVKVPLKELTSKEYGKKLAAQIDRARASKTPAIETKAEGDHTTHYSVVDAAGNAVATTTTLNGGYGAGVWVRGGGFFMNNEMDDFAAQPGTPNMYGLVQGEQNAIQPGKRMLSAMSPTIVLDPSGRLLMVTGAAGGPTIITATMEVILNVIEHHMSLADAMRAPRLHHQALPDEIRYEPNGLAPAVVDSLKAMGHQVRTSGLANVNSILRVAGGWHGVYEPRSVGGAVGY